MQSNMTVAKTGVEKPTSETSIVERYIEIKGVAIRVRSVFNNKISLDKALGNIAMRRLSENKNEK